MRRPYTVTLTILSLFILLAACAPAPEAPAPTPRIALVAAYAPEIEALLAAVEEMPHASIETVEQDRGVTYYLGQYRGQEVVLFATGISIGNAAMTTQMALDRYDVSHLIFSGIAGGVNERWLTGDVVVPERWSYHDESVYINPEPGGEGYILPDYYAATLERAKVANESDPHAPDYENFGMIWPDTVSVSLAGGDGPEERYYFSADADLLNVAREAIDGLPPLPVTDTRTAQLSVGGHGVTGSVFMDNARYREWVRRVWNAEVTEMESATIAQVCYVNEVPWVIIRSVSDLAGGQEGKNEENVYDRVASKNAVAVLFAMMDILTQDG